MNENLEDWLYNNFIEYEIIDGDRFKTDLGIMHYIYDNSVTSIEGELNLSLTYDICEDILDSQIDYIVYQFGGNFYYTPISKVTNIEMNDLKYLGQYKGYLPKDESCRSFLGLHGRYEIMNGTRDYKDWCKKANFLQLKSLGICEKNTLAGTLPFQLACKKAKIQPIIGYTAEVENVDGLRYDLKLYCINKEGWINLLNINKIINIDQEGYIEEIQIAELLDGLCAVISPGQHINRSMLTAYAQCATKALFQITTNEYRSDARDKSTLLSIKDYFDNMQDLMDCVLISDAYCLDYEEVHIKEVLNKQGKTKFTYASENHFLKSFEELASELSTLFDPNDNRYATHFNKSLQGLKWISENCQFNIDTNTLFLPKYEMTDLEIEQFGDTTSMFDTLIWNGLSERFNEDLSGPHADQMQLELEERIDTERSVIIKGGFIDYFLILWDVVNWCKTQNIQVGPGRGSAAGCLISYALGIVKINPLEFNLIFERFLNESRIESELPDIDLDFASDRRDEVFEYIKQRYGKDYFCRVGTYGTLQMRGVVKELARAYNYTGEYNLNFITHLIESNEEWTPIFKDSLNNKVLKGFVHDNPAIINDSRIILNSIKSTSMHACATIIVPKLQDSEGKALTIYNQIPVRMEDGMLVSEWEGDIMANAGFLKEDILSTKQMAKIGHIFDLVKERTGDTLDMEKIPLDDPNVYELFKNGHNQDVFHFGSTGLTSYLKQVKPENIEELIASIALYRPGAMASNAHMDYVKLKKGELEPIYDYKLESVTRDTYGLYIYQEQIMQAVQLLGEFTLTEADGVRKAMGKKIKSKMDGYKVQFLDNAVKAGCPKDEANAIWDKMEVFSAYGFNKSHAAAYSVIGYYCNWLKYYYPLEFWTIAFQMGKDDKIQDYVSEVHKIGDIQITSPDINKSQVEFKSDSSLNRIYWNLSSIKFVGQVASTEIIKERDLNGKYFSMEEFCERLSGKGVNKRVVENLVIAGCFDEMYNIHNVADRYIPLSKYFEFRKEDLPKQYKDNKNIDHYWSIKQSEISQLSNMNYDKLIAQSLFAGIKDPYITAEKFIELKAPEKKGPIRVIAGMIEEIVVRKTKDKRPYAVIKLQQDDDYSSIRIWPQQLENKDNDPRLIPLLDVIEGQESRLAIFRGEIKFNSFTKGNEMVLSDRIQGPIVQFFK